MLWSSPIQRAGAKSGICHESEPGSKPADDTARSIQDVPKHSATERTGLPYDPVTASASISSPSPNPDTRVEAHVYALSDVGSTREHNEDTFLVADLESGMPVEFASAPREIRTSNHGLLFLVADGMGGAASGELASSMAGDVVLDALREHWVSSDTIKHDDFAEALRQATETANSRIHRFARENPEHRGMGTTATIAGLLGDWLFLAQVGDSRAYLIRNGQAQQLTKDQSLMQRLVEAGELTQDEADASERRNIILQALGPGCKRHDRPHPPADSPWRHAHNLQ